MLGPKRIICALLLAHFLTMHLRGNPLQLPIHHLNSEAKKLFGYNPGYELLHGKASDTIMITCHGYGANKQIGQIVAQQVTMPIATFNFPDHDLGNNFDVHKSSLGTIDDYLPLIYLLQAVVKSGIKKINLYGFSAGGGAIITTLAILNSPTYHRELMRIGVTAKEAQKILTVISQGTIILDAPLKSIAELLTTRPQDTIFQVLAKRYKKNRFEPIDCIDKLKGLTLSFLVYFEENDEILSNRDDELFYQKLKAINNNGKTQLIRGRDGGHNGFHRMLWEAYHRI